MHHPQYGNVACRFFSQNTKRAIDQHVLLSLAVREVPALVAAREVEELLTAGPALRGYGY